MGPLSAEGLNERRIEPPPTGPTASSRAPAPAPSASESAARVEQVFERVAEAARLTDDPERVERIVAHLNEVLSAVNNKIRFRVVDDRTMIEIVDPESGEVLKTIPPGRAAGTGPDPSALTGLLVDQTG